MEWPIFAHVAVAVPDISRAIVLLFILSCSSSIGRQHLEKESSRNPAGPTPPAASVSGRVLLDGRPVEHFWVAAAREGNPFEKASVVEFQPSDGTFSLPQMPAGEWRLLFLGYFFAQHTVHNINVTDGSVTRLGDISVRPGFRVQGQVIDATGSPIANAAVTLMQSGPLAQFSDRTDDVGSIWEVRAGNHRAYTSKRGHFEINGIVSADISTKNWRVFASVHGKMSLPRWLPAGNHSVRLSLLPTSIVEGSVERLDEGIVIARPLRSVSDMIPASVVEGKYRFELPQGDYEISVFPVSPRSRRYLPVHVSVVDNKTVTLNIFLHP